MKFKKWIFAFLYAYVRGAHYLDLYACSRIFVFEIEYSYYSIPMLYGPSISVDMKINYPYHHDWTQKYKLSRMLAYRMPVFLILFFIYAFKSGFVSIRLCSQSSKKNRRWDIAEFVWDRSCKYRRTKGDNDTGHAAQPTPRTGSDPWPDYSSTDNSPPQG